MAMEQANVTVTKEQYLLYAPFQCKTGEVETTVKDVLGNWVGSRKDIIINNQLNQRGLRLDNYVSAEDKAKRNQRKKTKHIKLSRTELKNRGLLDISQDNITYNDGLILHTLWKQYISSVVQPGPGLSRCNVLAVCDFHGALITVVQSRNPSTVNLSGIVVKETERTFQIISEDNRLRTLLKADSNFYLPIDGVLYILHGQYLCHRAAQRSKLKVKAKDFIQLK